MSSKKITGDAACPSCRDKGRDSKGNHLLIFKDEEGQEFAKCNKCGHYIPPEDFNPEAVVKNVYKEKTPEQIREELDEVFGLPQAALTSRRIPKHVADRYEVRVGYSEVDGETITEHYYPRHRDGEVVAYNVRNLEPKAFYYRGSPKGGTDPFGWNQLQSEDVGRRKLYIFEDELSCMSGYAVLEHFQGQQYKHIKPACISWSAGVGSDVRDLSSKLQQIQRFQEIIYCHDNDDAGRESRDRVRKLLPTCKFIQMPLKDMNDMQMAGRSRDAYNLLTFEAKTKAPDGAIRVSDALKQSLEGPKRGLSFPWEGLDALTYGQFSEVYSIGGGVGIGKTETAHEIAAWNIGVHEEPTAVILLEEPPWRTLHKLAGKLASVPFHRPESFNLDLYMAQIDRLDPLLHLWENKGQNDWDNIKMAIRHWVVAYGVKSVFMDNLTAMIGHLPPSEQNTEISRIAGEAAGLVDELDFRFFIYSHLNPPKKGPSHERGGEVHESQFTGGRGLSRWSQNMFGFERDKQAQGDAKHDSILRYIKDRKYGNTGIIGLCYDPATGRLNERILESETVATTEGEDDELFG